MRLSWRRSTTRSSSCGGAGSCSLPRPSPARAGWHAGDCRAALGRRCSAWRVGWLGLGGVLYTWSRNPAPLELPARAHADERGLFVDGRRLSRRGGSSAGGSQPRAHGPPVVHVRARWGRRRQPRRARRRARPCAPRARSTSTPRGVGALLGARPADRRAEGIRACRGTHRARARVRDGRGQAAPVALALAVVALLVMLVGVALPTHVVVGADGVLLRWLGTARFVAWSRVIAVEEFDGGVVLALDGGGGSRCARRRSTSATDPERAAMVERMRVAWRAHAHVRPTSLRRASCRRAGGRTREWVRAMRALVHEGRRLPHRERAAGAALAHRRRPACRSRRAHRCGARPRAAPRRRDGTACAPPRSRAPSRACASPSRRRRPIPGRRASDDELAATLDAIESEGDDDAAIER